MGNISIEVNNREFLIACTDGDEDKVKNLALKFASRVKSIKDRVGELDQQRLFLLAGILAEEENQELNDDLSIDEMTEAFYQQVFDLNFKSALLVSKAFKPTLAFLLKARWFASKAKRPHDTSPIS